MTRFILYLSRVMEVGFGARRSFKAAPSPRVERVTHVLMPANTSPRRQEHTERHQAIAEHCLTVLSGEPHVKELVLPRFHKSGVDIKLAS